MNQKSLLIPSIVMLLLTASTLLVSLKGNLDIRSRAATGVYGKITTPDICNQFAASTDPNSCTNCLYRAVRTATGTYRCGSATPTTSVYP